jgi:glycosyltransferase involved in cell wall biosynthesis
VYNCDRYLAEAIQSVLVQSYQSVEIIVIDDGSSDNSAAVAKSFGSVVKYFYQTNSGSAAARNHGIRLAQGSFFAFLDADDLWIKDKLKRQIAAFANDTELDVVFGYVEQFYSPELDESIKQKIKCPNESIAGYHPGTMLIKRESFNRVGQFDNNWKLGEVFDWYIKAKEQCLKSLMLSEILLKRRLHDTNKGIGKRQLRTDYVRILKASLDRRRAK